MHTDQTQLAAIPRNGHAETRSASLSAAARRRAEEGLHPTNLPLGYRCDTGPVAVPYPAVAPLVKEAIELYATGKYSLRKLLDMMVEKGLRSKRAHRPSLSAFCDMLTNPFYAVWVAFAGRKVRGQHIAIVRSDMLLKRANEISLLDDFSEAPSEHVAS